MMNQRHIKLHHLYFNHQTEAILHSILNHQEEMTAQIADQNINHVLQPNNSLLNLHHSPSQDTLRKENV